MFLAGSVVFCDPIVGNAIASVPQMTIARIILKSYCRARRTSRVAVPLLSL
jgi:hypothetical protein